MSLPPKRVAVVLNPGARAVGEAAGLAEARVAEAFATHGISSAVEACEGPATFAAVRAAAASGVDAVVAGGGDGTLSAAAAALADGDMPLGVLPLGTRNHFARDLGVGSDLASAVRTIAEGRLLRVDLGQVNDRKFLNNSSIGLYPAVVEGREALRGRAALGKWLAMVYAIVEVLRRYPLLSVTVHAGEMSQTLRTPFVVVGNNAYELGLLELGRRNALDRGQLSLYLARHETKLALVRLALLALAGRLERNRDFRALAVESVRIESRRPRLRVAADGEVVHMRSPIDYRIRPRALPVLAPRRPERS